MELLTVESFLANGHPFTLWVYESITTPIPSGVEVRDANEILEKKHLFSYQSSNQYGHGKGSLAGFSDIFRYKLLYEVGGWWVDMDVTCLKPFTFEEPYFFRSHHDFLAVGNVIKCPAKCSLMKFCYEEAIEKVSSENRDWNLPIRILNEGLKKHNLTHYVFSDLAPPDQWHIVKEHVFGKEKLRSSYHFIHWLNEVWRSKHINKNTAVNNSSYQHLLSTHGVVYDSLSVFDLIFLQLRSLYFELWYACSTLLSRQSNAKH